MSDCLFCKIIAGEIPSSRVYEDELCYAFYDIDPQAPTHFLVIPKEHIGSCGEIGPENAAVVGHIFRSSPGWLGSWAWRASGWCPTAASRRASPSTTCTSMCWPDGI